MNKAPTEAPAIVVELNGQLQLLHSREDLAALIRSLADDFRRKPEEWENGDLTSYLEAMAAWVDDSDGYHRNRGEAVPDQATWKALGQILLAAKVYE
jgi:hypothetical protein